MPYENWIKTYLSKFSLDGTSIEDIKTFNDTIYRNRYSSDISYIINEVYRKVILNSSVSGIVTLNFNSFVNTTPISSIMYLAETMLGIDTLSVLKKYLKK